MQTLKRVKGEGFYFKEVDINYIWQSNTLIEIIKKTRYAIDDTGKTHDDFYEGANARYRQDQWTPWEEERTQFSLNEN